MKALVDRPHGRLQHAVDPVLDVHRIVLRLDVDVAGAALDRRIEGGVHEPDDRALIRGELFDAQLLVGELVLARNQVMQFGTTRDDAPFARAVQRLNLLTTELQAGVMKARMQPIGSAWGRC